MGALLRFEFSRDPLTKGQSECYTLDAQLEKRSVDLMQGPRNLQMKKERAPVETGRDRPRPETV